MTRFRKQREIRRDDLRAGGGASVDGFLRQGDEKRGCNYDKEIQANKWDVWGSKAPLTGRGERGEAILMRTGVPEPDG